MKNLITFVLFIIVTSVTAQTSKEIEMVSLINQVRTNPKSFIPFIESYIESANSFKMVGGSMINKSTGKSVDNILEAKKLISFLKTQKPVNELSISITLYSITKSHANYLDSTNQICHTGPNGQRLVDRTKLTGYLVGENCATGLTATDAMVQLLIDLSSPTKGHRNNIFNPDYKQISIGNSGNVWVQDFIVNDQK